MLLFFREIIWGDGTLILIFLLGIILLFKTRFVQLRNLKGSLVLPFSSKNNKDGLSQFSALTTALAGTMGVGNIVGVGVALSIGGAGALFWMWVAAFIGMGIKYSEIYLSVKFRKGNAVGPLGYMKYGLKSSCLAYIFAFVTLFTSFGIGNCVQVSAMKECLSGLNSNAAIILSFLILVPFFIVILKSEKAVFSATEKIIPIISILYIIGCLTVIIINISSLPYVFTNIFRSAFKMKTLSGAVTGVTVKNCIRTGVSQGVFSNEAGMGSSSIVLSSTENSSPHRQGLWGIFEVFFDTMVICTLTGIAVLSSGIKLDSLPSSLVTYTVFTTGFGIAGGVFLAITTSVFSMATLICWSYYGTRAIKFLSNKSICIMVYKICFCIFAIASLFINFTSLYILSDILNGIMLLVNISALFLLFNKIEH